MDELGHAVRRDVDLLRLVGANTPHDRLDSPPEDIEDDAGEEEAADPADLPEDTDAPEPEDNLLDEEAPAEEP